MKLRNTVICLFAIAFDLGAAGPVQALDLGPEEVVESLFLGQVYETGDVYLLGVRGDQEGVSWPRTLIIRSMEEATDADLQTAGFSGVINGPQDQAPEEDSPSVKPAGFFETVFDATVEDSDIGHYTAAGNIGSSYPVVAFDPRIKLAKPDFSVSGKKRPVTVHEAEAVNAARAAAEREADSGICTTVPGFIDAAAQLWEARLDGSELSVRVSRYQDPGCGGHLTVNYVIDVLRAGKVVRTSRIQHYYGSV